MQVEVNLDIPALTDGTVRLLFEQVLGEMRTRHMGILVVPTTAEVADFTESELKATLATVSAEMIRRGMVLPLAPQTLAKMPPIDIAEQALVRIGHKIEAIKHYRDRVGRETKVTPGLKDSKDVIDAFGETLKREPGPGASW